MPIRDIIVKIVQQDDLNFLLTNAMPRRLVTRFMGWFSRIEVPIIRDLSISVWRFFSNLDLREAEETEFTSMHHCFTRRLKAGARPIDPDPDCLVSPCDAIVGAAGSVTGGQALQVKGSQYALADLIGDAAHAATFDGGLFVTLRLTSSMYHRFHAPHDCQVTRISHIFGDAFNVNPVTLRRVTRLYCRNERAVIRTSLTRTGHAVTLVPVAAILVSGIRLAFHPIPPVTAHTGCASLACDVTLRRGEEMGWFEHGSTIIVLAPAGFSLCDTVQNGSMIRMGERLMRVPHLR